MSEWAATERIPARVGLAEGLVLQGEIHLQARVALREGPELPVEMLNRPEPFFPLSLPSGEVIFVSKAQVAVVAYRQVPAPEDPERQSAARLIGLEIMLSGGAEYRGFAVSELPPIRGRASDFLNSAEAFFCLTTNEATVCIHRAHVRVARPTGS